MNNPTDKPVAALWRRLAAILYDSIVIIAIWIVVGFVVLSMFGIEEARTVEGEAIELDPLYQFTLFTAMLGSALLFFGWFWTNSGQTIGMQAWKIRIQNADGSTINWQQVLLRYVTAPIALALGGIGYWWSLFDPQKRSWPDLVSHSMVVKTER
jgi:uncharacterized RDD family membrane protein YckC